MLPIKVIPKGEDESKYADPLNNKVDKCFKAWEKPPYSHKIILVFIRIPSFYWRPMMLHIATGSRGERQLQES